MPSLEIKKYPAAVLKNKAKEVKKVTDVERRILKDMAEAMYLNSGIGLAAPQVGIDRQFVVIDVGEGQVNLINPVIIKKRGCDYMEEGCLSLPGMSVKVKRAQKVSVQSLNEKGEHVNFEADGLFARAIQHEIDHLNGKLIIDYLNPIKRLLAVRFHKKRVDNYEKL